MKKISGGHTLITLLSVLTIVHCLLCVSSCANRGVGPQGGPKDSIPPVVVKEEPLNGSLQFTGNKIEVTFDEYIQLDKITENVLISPPQQKPPVVKAVGKRLLVSFEEPLQDSTTYTISFGQAICDFNEKNPMTDYTFSFSTCDHFDSLQIAGRLVQASDLNPVSGVTVGIQRVLDDSAFARVPFTRIAKTDAAGRFTIYNVREGRYRIYALNDVSRDYVYQPGEQLAFTDSVIVPTVCREETDSTVQVSYQPSDLVLWYFAESKQRRYLQRVVRDKPHYWEVRLVGMQDSMPTVRALPLSVVDTTASDSSWIDWTPYTLWGASAQRDTLYCYLTDSVAIRQDSLAFEISYLATDSVYNLERRTDTLLAVYRAPNLSARALETRRREEAARRLRLSCNAKSSFDIYDTLCLTADFPIAEIREEAIHVRHKNDTSWQEQAFRLQPKDSLHRSYQVLTELLSGHQYELKIDSAAIHDIYGVSHNATRYEAKLKTQEEYSTLLVRVTPLTELARVQVLDEKEQVVRELPVSVEGTLFANLKPGNYYLRLYIDENQDGAWTTGDWDRHRQPEPVYYFAQKLALRANWDFEEEFRYLEGERLEQKPKEIVKDASSKKK